MHQSSLILRGRVTTQVETSAVTFWFCLLGPLCYCPQVALSMEVIRQKDSSAGQKTADILWSRKSCDLLLIVCLFDDSVSSWQYAVSNGFVVSEQRVERLWKEVVVAWLEALKGLRRTAGTSISIASLRLWSWDLPCTKHAITFCAIYFRFQRLPLFNHFTLNKWTDLRWSTDLMFRQFLCSLIKFWVIEPTYFRRILP
jgi:hypothetical protein